MTAPEKLTIDTPEQVSLEFALASVGSRFLALAVDTLIQAAGALALGLAALAAALLARTGFTQVGAWGFALLVFVAFVLYFGYFALFESLWQGQTPGKRLVGLRVIGATGRPLTPYEAILRNLLRTVDQLPGMYAIGIVSVLVTGKNQRLGDLAANTVVVHERAETDAMSYTASGGRTRHGAGRLDGQEVVLIESFLRRRHDLGETTRTRACGEIATRVRRRLGIPDASQDDERLLEEIAAEYRDSGRYR